jgi:hypothetical protein
VGWITLPRQGGLAVSGVDELVAFFRAALDRDEQVALEAQRLLAGDWVPMYRDIHAVAIGDGEHRQQHMATADTGDLATHIARWEPARVLALMSALRTLLDGFSYEAGETRAIMAIGQALYGQEPRWRDEWQLSAPA